jgi:thiosulfate dehydrogenase
VIRIPMSWRTAAAAAAVGALGGLLAWAPAAAADAQLEQAVARGRENFLHNTFGGGGRVCDTCHLGGGTLAGKRPDGVPMPSLSNAAAVFPRISEDDHAIITIADQVRMCVAGAIKGRAPAYGSDELNSLVAYVTSLAQGKSIDMGGAPK